MLIYLLRHGLTEYNAEKRYQGQRDIPLSAAGRAMLCRADISPKTVYITPLCRTRQTAEVLFPGAKLIEIDGLKEMCFGSFEGRNYIEMEHDPDYLAWVAANCESPCPDGETKAAFCERICAAFSALVDKALADGEEMLVILAHGGTQMAAMERYALPHKDYYAWCAPNAGGFVLDARPEAVTDGALAPQGFPFFAGSMTFRRRIHLTAEEAAGFFAQQTHCGVACVPQTGEVVGMYILHPNNVGRCGHICNTSYAVSREARGHHVGEALVRDSLAQGKAHGFRILQFNAVVATNAVARHLYEKLGFTQLGVIPGGFRMPNDTYEDIVPYYHEL